MTLPAPNLDDRTFQDLVDDAKRFVQRRCPEWSDHNVSDPGVTLIETYAMVVDQLLYRLNRVPDRLYVKFLELLGISLFPPTAAQVPVTFWLSAPREDTVTVPRGTEVATDRVDDSEPVVFGTERELPIVACALTAVATSPASGGLVSRTEQLRDGARFPCFSATPQYDDAMLIGLSNPVPSCVVALRFDCEVEGVGVDPRQPPLVWEAWTGRGWTECELERDDTGGLNRQGDIVLHVPDTHEYSVIQRVRAGWLRCRVVPAAPGQPFYTAPPQVHGASAFTIGGTVVARFADTVREEIVGLSEGVPAQQFALAHQPVVTDAEALVLEVAAGNGWELWTRVEHFGESGSRDRHFTLDPSAGAIAFGPAIREPDGSVTQYGAVPPKGAPIRIPVYHTGGGRRGNVARSTVRALRSSLPYVARIDNRHPGTGGVDGETLDNAKLRVPMMLRSRERAVTVRDYEILARAASPRVARVHCMSGSGTDASVVRVVLVPHADSDERAGIALSDLQPSDETLARVTAYLDERRTIGTRLLVEPPRYRGVTVVVTLHATATADPDRLRERAIRALNTYLHPLLGGPDAGGWPFGRAIVAGELFAVLQGLPGVDLVDKLSLHPADATSGARGPETNRIPLAANALAYSFDHQVRVLS